MAPLNPYSVDADVTSEATAAESAQAQSEVLLQYLLGVNAVGNLNQDPDRLRFAQDVSRNICRTMAGVRNGLVEANLTRDLNQDISTALRRVARRGTDVGETERTNIAVNAIYQRVGINLMRDIVKEGIVPFAGTEKDKPLTIRGDVDLPMLPLAAIPVFTGTIVSMELDLSKPFWSSNAKVNSFDELITALDKQKIETLGITIPGRSPNYLLTPAERAGVALHQWQVVKLANDYGKSHGNRVVGTDVVEWDVDLDFLIRQRTTADAPHPPTYTADLRGRSFGSFTHADLVAIFNHNGGRPYWELFASDLADRFDPTDLLGTDSWASIVTDEIFARAGKAPTSPLAATTSQLHDVQKEISAQQDTFKRLNNGSSNPMGATLAMAMITRDPALRAVTQGANEAALLKDVTKINTKKSIHKTVDALRAAAPVGITSYPGLLGVTTFDQLKAEKTLLDADMAIVSFQTVTAWSSSFGNNKPVDVPAQAGPVATAAERGPIKDAKTQIRAQLEEVKKEMAKYESIEGMLLDLHRYAVTGAGYTGLTELANFVDTSTGAIKPGALKGDINVRKIADDILKELNEHPTQPLESTVELDENLKKKNEEIKEAKKSTATGDELQQKVFNAYLQKHQGLSDVEAQGVSNYMTARTLLDTQQVDGMLDVMFDGSGNKKDRFNINVINEVAKGCGFATASLGKSWYKKDLFGNNSLPDWVNVSEPKYPKLCTAYFALKSLYDGNSKYPYLKLGHTALVAREMKKIARLMAPIHAEITQRDFLATMTPEEKKKVTNPKAKALQAFETFISGEPPEAYQSRIDNALSGADKSVNWKRRYLSWMGGGALSGLVTHPQGLLRGFLGNWKYGPGRLVGKTVGGVAGGVGAVASSAKNNAGTLGWVGAATVLGGPLTGLAVYMVRRLTKPAAAPAK
jgi:hypothetical protein